MKNDEKDYTFVFNKVFTGSYLEHNLGHEIINFIKTDNGQRYVYLNPCGRCSDMAAKKTKYVLHIMDVTYKNEKYYELLAVSAVDDSKTNKKNFENQTKITFKKHLLDEIFTDNGESLFSFKVAKFYKPKKNYRILFKIKSKKSDDALKLSDNNIIMINVKCNPQHHIAYAIESDVKVLKELINSKYLELNDDNVNLKDISDEQCFAVISDRTNLEDSLSNQIAYFLTRDYNILIKFIELLNKHLGSNKINTKAQFEILREKNHIDLLLKSDDSIVVIENKIDSGINGIKSSKRKQQKSQLSRYYDYIMKNKEFKNISKENKHFFILEPEYSSITRDELTKEYLHGKHYNIISYTELYETLHKITYSPYGQVNKTKAQESKFLYNQFLESIEFVKSSKAEQKQKIAYIRLKQKIKQLEANKNITI